MARITRNGRVMQLSDAIDKDKAVSVSNATRPHLGQYQAQTVNALMRERPGVYELFTGPDGQRMIRKAGV